MLAALGFADPGLWGETPSAFVGSQEPRVKRQESEEN